MPVLREQPPNKRFDRSAKQQRCLVPVARCAPAPGQAWRWGPIVKVEFIAILASVLLGAGEVEAQHKLDSLLVYGEGFVFSVREPEGWLGDTEHAGAFQANVLFHRKSQAWQSTDGLIRVRLGDKTDERTEEDLAADMNGYRSQFPKIQFKDIAVSHPEYRVYPKLFFVPNDFYEYVAYVNPGPKSNLMFSVSMNRQKKEATKSELAAFSKVIASPAYAKGAPTRRSSGRAMKPRAAELWRWARDKTC